MPSPLVAAAERGPLALVEQLIREGALEWQPDGDGRRPLDAARQGHAAEREAIIELLDRPVLRDPQFRAAVAAIHAGDIHALEALLDAAPRLLHERIVEPECYRASGRPQYFLEPNLLWFVANNPILVDAMPANIVAVLRALLARGPERADLDYTLELVMTSAPAREQGHQRALVDALLDAGATATPQAIVVTTAFALAVVNDHLDATRVALAAGAEVNAFLPVHSHSVALHQAALHDDPDLLALLLAHGARRDIVDTAWHGTPLDWAIHERRPRAAALLA